MSVQEIHLNQVTWKNIMPTIHAVYGDTGRELRMILDDITVADGMTGDITFERPDGTYYSTSCTLEVATNSFLGNITQGLTKVGNCQAQLRITQSEKVTSTYTFIIVVHESNAGSVTPQEGGSVLDALEKAEQALETAIDAQELAEEAMEDLVDLKKTFAPLVTETVSDQAIATFDDGADNWPIKECVVNVDAVQDLHGYDNPWPAGGGKNKAKLSANNVGSNQNIAVTYSDSGATITATGTYGRCGWLIPVEVGKTYTFSCNGIASSTADAHTLYFGSADATWNPSSPTYIYARTVGETKTNISFTFTAQSSVLFVGAYVTVNNTSATMTLSDVLLEVGSSATAYEPHTNICPITGWSEAKVTRCGKNLLNYDSWENIAVTRGTAVWGNNGVTLTATADDCYTQYSEYYGFPFIPVQSGQAITLSWQETTNKDGKVFIFTDTLAVGTTVNNKDVKSLIYTPPAGVTSISFRFGVTNSGDTIAYKNIQVELGSTASAYEAPNIQTYTISLGDTRYGAVLDAVRGKLRVTYGYLTDNGTLNWTRNDDGSFYVYNPGATAEQSADGCSCNYAPFVLSFDGMNVFFRGNGLISLGRGWGSLYATVDALKSAFASTPIQFVYELATPIEVDLTPTEITTLLGTNNIFADTGDVEVEYCADTKLYIQKLISQLA